MKRMVAVDDVDGRSLADVTTYIGLDGQWREVDLTADHDAQLRLLIKQWWEAGRSVSSVPRQRPETRQHVRHGMTSRDYWKGFRAWCDERDIGYTTDTGKFYPARKNVLAYEAHLDEQAQQAVSQLAS